MRTKIEGSYVVAFDGQTHRLLKDGVVVFEDDRIVYVGKSYSDPVDETIEAKGRLVSPGLINIHGLASLCITHFKIDGSGHGYITPRSFAVEGKERLALEGRELETSAHFSIAECLKGGATTIATVTTGVHSRFEEPLGRSKAIAEVAGKMGARTYVHYPYRSGVKYWDEKGVMDYHWDEEAGQKALKNAIQFVKTYADSFDGRVNGFLSPSSVDTCSPELLRATKEAAQELGVIKKLHTAEYLPEFNEIKRRYGKTPIQFLESINFLDPQTILIHVIWTTVHIESGHPYNDMSDLEILSKTGTTVATCPVIFSRVGQILHSHGLYQRKGVNLAIGTDAFPQDMLREMRFAATLSKIAERNTMGLTARDVFNAATLNGAKALGRPDLGRLAPGMKADIVVFDLSPLHMGLMDDPIKSLVYFGSQDIVETVIVDGKQVVENHRIPGLDEEALAKEANAINQKQKRVFVAHNPLGLSMDEYFPPSFPIE